MRLVGEMTQRDSLDWVMRAVSFQRSAVSLYKAAALQPSSGIAIDS